MSEKMRNCLNGLTTKQLKIVVALLEARIENNTEEIVEIILGVTNDDDLHAITEVFLLAADEPEGGETA